MTIRENVEKIFEKERQEGRQEGHQEGAREKALRIAEALLKNGAMKIEEIIQVTGLSMEDIKK